VAATVTVMQAVSQTLLGRRLVFDEVVDVLQQDGAAALSAPDPAAEDIRYYLYDHAGSIDYLFTAVIGQAFSEFEYLASHDDLMAYIGADASSARLHYANHGVFEDRVTDRFDGLAYIASHVDLITAFGADANSGAGHYVTTGRGEGRQVTFDVQAYLAANADVAAAFSDDLEAATLHYVTTGWAEGRSTAFVDPAIAGVADVNPAAVEFG
jgi:hypothetical protein